MTKFEKQHQETPEQAQAAAAVNGRVTWGRTRSTTTSRIRDPGKCTQTLFILRLNIQAIVHNRTFQ